MLANLTQEDFQKLARIVQEETGNQVSSKNHSMIESRIRSHLLKLGIASMSEYWIHFQKNEEEEREVLQSLMTTHYTFFFREYAHFEQLEKWVETELPRIKSRFEKTKAPVAVWSAACSRGQEVYSLAMFLNEILLKKHGIPFEILGTDIDSESVAYSQNGVYPIKEANTIPQNYLNAYWKKGTGAIKDFAAIHPNLKSKCTFQSANLIEPATWNIPKKFDVIFCRNVFIYFSEENVKKISLSLAEKLDDRGLFISGMSEPLRFPEWKLRPVGPSGYQKVLEQTPSTSTKSTPAANETKHQPTPASEAPLVVQEEKESLESYRVLCVDDSTTIQALIKKIFAADPLCSGVDVAIHGGDAAQKMKQTKYDLITLDIHMPQVSGIEFLENHYNLKVDPPVLMISSVNRTDLELATKSISLGAFDYIEKPAMNKLQKSSDEILTKAHMALRSRKLKIEQNVGNFDASIAQKIVVADASQCLRLVVANKSSFAQLEQVIRGQKNEYRSPAMIVVWTDEPLSPPIEAQILQWTQREVHSMRDHTTLLRPNMIYALNWNENQKALASVRQKTLSIQFLTKFKDDPKGLMLGQQRQILIDENISIYQKELEKTLGIRVSDICPATSFPSLSVEYFAQLRKAAA